MVPKKKGLMVCDVSRAFFYAPVQHEIHVELSEEAKKTVEDINMCAKLRMSMYGTKAAAQNWQKKVRADELTSLRSHRPTSTGEVSLLLRSHVACVSKP